MRTVHLESISTNQFKSNVKPYLNDKSSAKRLQALVRTANCIMNDVQIPNIYVDIVKISDTRNEMQKLHINYILQLLSKNKYYENLLVLNTNTILKDLGDSKTDLVAVALDFVGQTRLLDEYILRYFVKLANSNEVIRNLVAKNIHQFFDNPEYVKMFGLKKLLAEMCDDANNLWALNSAYILMPEYDVLDENDILGMYMCAGLERKILYLMILNKKIEHNRFDPLNYDKLKSICYNNLDSCITKLTYLSSKILLAIDNEHAQYIYNTLLSYANDNDLNSYLILEFIRDMIAKQKEYDFTYENSDFVIFKTETYDIKKIKLDIICHRHDSFSLQEILYCKHDNKLIHDVLYIMLQKNICEPELLKICCKNDINKTVEVIKHSCPLSEDWKTVIKNNFCIFRDFDAKLDDVVCIASEVGIDCGPSFGNDLTLPQKCRVYSSMFKSDCIIKEEFLAKLNWKEDVNDRFDYKNSQSVMSPNLLASNLFDGYRFVHCCDTKNLPLVTQTTNNVTQTKAILYEYIDPDVSFNIELGDNTLVFNIIRIETDTHICIQDYINRKFSKKYKEVIKNLTIYDLPLTLAIAVNGTNRTLDITALDLLLPHSSDMKTFNEKFCSLKYYEIISANKYNYEKYKIDSKLFACTLMDYVIYGMEMCGQIIIKSDQKDALKTFISALE